MDQRIDGKSLHEPLELFRAKLTYFLTCPWPCEMTLFNSFIQEQKTVSFPEKPFDLPAGGFAAEQEECVGDEDIHLVFPFDDGCQGIDSVTKIRVTADKIHRRKGIEIGILKHDVPP